MKAIIQSHYGDETTLKLSDVRRPSIKKPTDINVAIKYVNLTAGDMHINTMDIGGPMRLMMKLIFGWKRPRKSIRGITGSGVVIETGAAVKKVKPGDYVTFIQSLNAGALADAMIINEKRTIQQVSKVILEAATTLPFGYLSAMHFINAETIKPGMKVLILGASGSVGSAALDIAVQFGASVTAVLRAKNFDKISTLNPHATMDYQSDAFNTPSKMYDVVFDAVNKYSKKTAQSWLKPGGAYMTIKKATREDPMKLNQLIEWLEAGKIQPLIEHVYPKNEYQKAHRHLYQGHKVGNILIQWDPT